MAGADVMEMIAVAPATVVDVVVVVPTGWAPGPCGTATSRNRSTPPWLEQVPDRVCEKLYVPSLHSAVAPAGGVDAANGRHTVLPAVLT